MHKLLSLLVLTITATIMFSISVPETVIAADDENCLMCHRYRKNGRITEDGNRKYYYVEESEFMQTVHFNVRCRDCHFYIDKIPHGEVTEGVNCARECHIKNPATGKYFSHKQIDDVYQKSAHGRSKVVPEDAEGNDDKKPYCIYCHINPKYDPDEKGQSQADIDRCNVCHDNEKWVNHWYSHTARRVKQVQKSPEDIITLCSSCHADEYMMRSLEDDDGKKKDEKFIKAAKSYDDSLHGSFVKLGWEKPAHCLSCHAKQDNYYLNVHDIRGVDDAKSSIHLDNRAETCAKCHKGGGKNFAKITEVHNAPKESSIYEYIIYEAFFWLVAGAFFVMTGRITLEHNRKIIDRLFKKGHHKDH